jgi:hypothetical protein
LPNARTIPNSHHPPATIIEYDGGDFWRLYPMTSFVQAPPKSLSPAPEGENGSAAPTPAAPLCDFLDLKAQFASIREEVMEAVTRVMESQIFILGRVRVRNGCADSGADRCGNWRRRRGNYHAF